jgi:hypothetical protein
MWAYSVSPTSLAPRIHVTCTMMFVFIKYEFMYKHSTACVSQRMRGCYQNESSWWRNGAGVLILTRLEKSYSPDESFDRSLQIWAHPCVATSRLARQEILRPSWIPKVHYRVNKTPPLIKSSQMNTRVYPKVSGVSQTLVEKQHKGLWRQNSLDGLTK